MEFPGGAIDKGESPDQAASRELREETGLIPGQLKKLGAIQVLGGLGNIRMHVFLASELMQADKQHEDSEHGLECMWITKEEWAKAIRDGKSIDSESLAAWALYLASKT